ncbi:MAG: hypothetical protein SFX73_31045 [Kofleriaceae bacterium]|nr:hypothetical protein [Kofleriaceae bacterium]
MKKLSVVAILVAALAGCGGKKAATTTPATSEVSSANAATGGVTYGGATYGGATYGGGTAPMPAPQ